MKNKVGIVGGGSWATALCKLILENEGGINWYIRSADSAEHIQLYKHNPHYLSSVQLRLEESFISTNLQAVVEQSDIVLLAIPGAFLEDSLKSLPSNAFENKLLISAIKGMIPSQKQIVARYLEQNFNINPNQFCVISGPCHAEEVALERLSYLTIAGLEKENTKTVASLLECRYLRTILSDDIYGTEYAAVLKNIYALAAGIAHGLGYGDNFISVLIANSMIEMGRFLDKIYPIQRDINESAYLGDLLVTAYSQFSRNRTFGGMIGKGYSVNAAQMEMGMVAEGYYAVKSIHEINENIQSNIPIIDAVYYILYQNKKASAAFEEILDKLV